MAKKWVRIQLENELGVTEEQAQKFPQNPGLVLNSDPTTIKVNIDTQETQWFHHSLKETGKVKERGAGRQGGGAMPQRIKLLPTITLTGQAAPTIAIIKLKDTELPGSTTEETRVSGEESKDGGASSGIIRIPLVASVTAGAGGPDEVWFVKPGTTDSTIFGLHRRQIRDPFIERQRKKIDPSYDGSKRPPPHLRAVFFQDGEAAGLRELSDYLDEHGAAYAQKMITEAKTPQGATGTLQHSDVAKCYRTLKAKLLAMEVGWRNEVAKAAAIAAAAPSAAGAGGEHPTPGIAPEVEWKKDLSVQSFFRGVREAGLTLRHSTLLARRVWALRRLLPQALSIVLIEKGARDCCQYPFDWKKMQQLSGAPWRALKAEQVGAIYDAYPVLVQLMITHGYVTDTQMDLLHVPWGIEEPRIERFNLPQYRHRAEKLTSLALQKIRFDNRVAKANKEAEAKAKTALDAKVLEEKRARMCQAGKFALENHWVKEDFVYLEIKPKFKCASDGQPRLQELLLAMGYTGTPKSMTDKMVDPSGLKNMLTAKESIALRTKQHLARYKLQRLASAAEGGGGAAGAVPAGGEEMISITCPTCSCQGMISRDMGRGDFECPQPACTQRMQLSQQPPASPPAAPAAAPVAAADGAVPRPSGAGTATPQRRRRSTLRRRGDRTPEQTPERQTQASPTRRRKAGTTPNKSDWRTGALAAGPPAGGAPGMMGIPGVMRR